MTNLGNQGLEIHGALLRGLALFNRAHFFEAHEALEDVWRESPRGTPLRRHLQGLVQLAVAFHHESRDNFIGARSVLDRGTRNLVGAEDSFPFLNLDRLRVHLADWQRHLADRAPTNDRKTRGLAKRPAPPRIMLRSRDTRKSQ